MDGPSYSLFHGGDNIRVNTSDIEDEEALERHKSIEKGLNDILGEDLLELEETESSIGHSQMYRHGGERVEHENQSYADHNPFYGQANYNNFTPYRQNQPIRNDFNGNAGDHTADIERLKNALESKSREVDHISGLLMAEKKRCDELEKRFKLSEAEKDRAFMQKQQFHDLLVEQKGRSSELDDEISNLKTKIRNLESTNTELVCELESTKTSLADCELKYRIIEKDVHASRQVDGILKQENDRHTAHAYMMQQEMSNLRNKLDEKELEVKNLQARYKELQKSRASVVEEHSSVTSQLKREIEEFQRTTSNTSQENLSLKKTVQSLERENFELQQTVNQLTLRCDKSKSRNDSDRANCSNEDESIAYFKKNRSSIVGSTPVSTNDEINRLKKELDRSTSICNSRKCEIESLEKQLKSKIDENVQLKEDENNALVEAAHFKEECQRLTGKLRLLDSELKHGDALEHQKKRLEEMQDQIEDLQKVNDDASDECSKLRLSNKELLEKLNETLQINEDLKREISSLNSELKCERDRLQKQLEIVQEESHKLKSNFIEISEAKDRIFEELVKLQQQNQRNETSEGLKEEKNLQNICTKCIDNKTIITKLEVENVELRNSCSNYLREISDLKESIKNLNKVVEMKKEYDVMLNELKGQAKEFSELVQAHSIAATPRAVKCHDQSVSTTPDLEYNSESAIRHEIELKMSQIMSSKIKQIESDALRQMEEIGRNMERLSSDLQKALTDVKMREKEVELLKLTLLTERKASSDRLASLQVELNANNQTLLMKLMNENDELKKELQEKTVIEMAERESVEILKKQWQDTEVALHKDIENLKNVIGEFEVEKSQIIKRLNKKYESAVKRGDNYRDYADAKEQHILSESIRIREEYQKKLNQMQTKYLEKLESILKEKEKEHTERIIKLEEEWRTRLESYQAEMCSK
ncbi:hypothetical protein Bhyg_13408 [Pseudolycoriella hygida]|uniref:Uncharacterized protein n=1 Tax=Pseudolycoriella hygida TaxID=35572 RepID=A0A9Q0RWF8_9DIPT|nr:hypothetical protein Bhyg_13408 [Pseudolycoriella hygida]